jgi:hypothetical protein
VLALGMLAALSLIGAPEAASTATATSASGTFPFRDPDGAFLEDLVVCSDSNLGARICDQAAWRSLLGLSLSSAGGAGIGNVFQAGGVGMIGASGLVLKIDIEGAFHLNSAGFKGNALVELGLGLGLPSFIEGSVSPYAVVNALSVLGYSGASSSMILYSPSLEIGLAGRGFAGSLAAGYGFFAGGGQLNRLGFDSDRALWFLENGSGLTARAQAFIDVRLSSAATLRVLGSLTDLHQTLSLGSTSFGSREIMAGRAALLLRFQQFTFGPALDVLSPNREPVYFGSDIGYRRVSPEETVVFLFGI